MMATRLWQNTAKVHFDMTSRPDGRRLILGGPVGQNPVTPERDARGLHDYFTKIFPDLAGIEFVKPYDFVGNNKRLSKT